MCWKVQRFHGPLSQSILGGASAGGEPRMIGSLTSLFLYEGMAPLPNEKCPGSFPPGHCASNYFNISVQIFVYISCTSAGQATE